MMFESTCSYPPSKSPTSVYVGYGSRDVASAAEASQDQASSHESTTTEAAFSWLPDWISGPLGMSPQGDAFEVCNDLVDAVTWNQKSYLLLVETKWHPRAGFGLIGIIQDH